MNILEWLEYLQFDVSQISKDLEQVKEQIILQKKILSRCDVMTLVKIKDNLQEALELTDQIQLQVGVSHE